MWRKGEGEGKLEERVAHRGEGEKAQWAVEKEEEEGVEETMLLQAMQEAQVETVIARRGNASIHLMG